MEEEKICKRCVNFDRRERTDKNGKTVYTYCCALRGTLITGRHTCYCWAVDKKRTRRARVELYMWQQANKNEWNR